MDSKNKEEKKPRLLPEDKEERKKELKKIFIYSELVKPKFDEGLDQEIFTIFAKEGFRFQDGTLF